MNLWNRFIDTPLGTTVNTALSVISTLYKSPQHPLRLFPACYVFNSRSLATASNSGDSLASRAHVFTIRRICRNWTLVNCRLNYSAISCHPILQSSTQLPTLNWQPNSLGSSLYSIGAAPIENIASNNHSTAVMGGCLTIARILLTRFPAATKQLTFLLAIVP
jgi:hypothetical protein